MQERTVQFLEAPRPARHSAVHSVLAAYMYIYHEADLIHGPAPAAARSLDVKEAGIGEERGNMRDGPIQWGSRIADG